MVPLQQFGGDWTIEKLDMFLGYLEAYLTALQNFKFKKIYIDAFAGTGTITANDGSYEISGSAKLALSASRKFDKYYFIEADKAKAQELNKMININFSELKDKITICQGDANLELEKICQQTNWRYNRALLFLDPFATEVAWSSLKTVAKTEAFDVWYLFPFQALQRMLRNDGQMDQSWIARINRLLGDENWINEFYKEDPQLNLFGTQSIIKDINTQGLIDYILARLKTIFPAVSAKPRVFFNKKNSPIFLFCFAVASRNEAAQRLALKIANHILRVKG